MVTLLYVNALIDSSSCRCILLVIITIIIVPYYSVATDVGALRCQ